MVNLKIESKPYPSRKSSTVDFSKNGKVSIENQVMMHSKFNTDLNDIVSYKNSPHDQSQASPNGKHNFFPDNFSTFSGAARRQTY
jgi:hypothetical protein